MSNSMKEKENVYTTMYISLYRIIKSNSEELE